MIVVKIMGGPGNQFFQYSFARKLAMQLNVEMKLDLDYNNVVNDSQHGVNYVLNKYNIKQNIASQEDVVQCKNRKKDDIFLETVKNSKNRFGKILRKALKYIPEYYYLSSSHVFDTIYDTKIDLFKKLTDNTYLDGYWTNYLFFDDIKSVITNELSVLNKFKTDRYFDYEKNIDNSVNSVSIHIRRGTYENLDFVNQYFGLLPISYYQKAIDYLNKTTEESIDYYVFSNDLDWAKDNLKFIPSLNFVDCGPGNDFLENQLMSKCKHNIIANSTFSWWAAYLNSNPQKKVIAPKVWYKNPKAQKIYETSNFIPHQWIRL